MKNIFLKLFIFTAIMSFVLIGCQKENMQPTAQDEVTELTPEQLDLKKKMDQAAQVLVQFSNDKEAMAEVQKMIDLKMYRDDYVKFKDLFQPESNDKLKSFGTTKFAKCFRETISSNKFKRFKGAEDFDLEAFLIENDLNLYVPYPIEDYPEDMRTPTISFHPLDNDSVNIGYELLTNKSTNNIQLVEKVDEDYSINKPLYLIVPIDDEGTSGGYSGGTGNGTGSSTGGQSSPGDHYMVKIRHMGVNKQYDGIFSGGPDIQILFADGVVIDASNEIGGVNIHYNVLHKFTRKEVRKFKNDGDMKLINATIDPDWMEAELTNNLAMVEIDKKGELKIGVSVAYAINKKITVTPSISHTFKFGNDFIGQREMPRYFFFQSQTNPAMEEGTRDGRTLRKLGDNVYFTTEIIAY